jgi:predicted DNA repair protein MutK
VYGGFHLIGDQIHDIAVVAGAAYGALIGWIVETLGYGIAGLVAGAVTIPVVGYLVPRLGLPSRTLFPVPSSFRA